MLRHFTDIVKSFFGSSDKDKVLASDRISKVIKSNAPSPLVFINDTNISVDEASGIIKILFKELKSIYSDAVLLSACHACGHTLSGKPALLHWSDDREVNNNRAIRDIIEQRSREGVITVVFCRVVYDINKKIISTAKVPHFMNGASNVYAISPDASSVTYIKTITDYNMSRIVSTK